MLIFQFFTCRLFCRFFNDSTNFLVIPVFEQISNRQRAVYAIPAWIQIFVLIYPRNPSFSSGRGSATPRPISTYRPNWYQFPRVTVPNDVIIGPGSPDC